MRSVAVRGVTPHTLQMATDHLQDRSGAVSVLWFGRAATALFYALARLRAETRGSDIAEVILPSTCCAGLVNAISLAGCRPRFADVDIRTGLVSAAHVADRVTDSTLAVIAIHLFGSIIDCSELARWARQRGIVLIEDCAQTGPPAFSGQFGHSGDIAIYSFGPAKLLGSGSGALVIYRPELASILNPDAPAQADVDPVDDSDRNSAAVSYRDEQLRLLRGYGTQSVGKDWFRRYDGLYIRSYEDDTQLAHDWGSWPERARRRIQNAELYAGILGGANGVRVIESWRESGVCWRFSMAVEDRLRAEAVTRGLREHGFHASNLFWPLNILFGPDDECPGAVEFGGQIINLWVDESIDASYVRKCAHCARELIESTQSEPHCPVESSGASVKGDG